MKKYLMLMALTLILTCIPAKVFAEETASTADEIKVEFIGKLLDAEEGERSAENYYKIDGNKFVVTYPDRAVKEYICVMPDDEDCDRGYYLDGDSSKEKLDVYPELKEEAFVPGDNEIRFCCSIEGKEYFTDYVTIKATPLIVDLDFIPAKDSEALWSVVGLNFVAGNAYKQVGDKFIVTYNDGSRKTFICTKYGYYDDYEDRYVTNVDYFENGVVKKRADGNYETLYILPEIQGGEFTRPGNNQVRLYVISGGEKVCSSKTYNVYVYKQLDSFSYEAPSELKGTVSGDKADINFLQEGAKFTLKFSDGTTAVYKPAKVSGTSGTTLDFTLDGIEDGERLKWSWEVHYNGKLTAGKHEVEVRVEYGFTETNDYYTVTFTSDSKSAQDNTKTKAANPLSVKGKNVKIRYAKIKKKAWKLGVSKVIRFRKKGAGKMSYKLSSAKKGSKSYKKYFKVNSKTGAVTVKKGLKKGTYKVKLKVKAAGNTKYKASSEKTVTCKISIR